MLAHQGRRRGRQPLIDRKFALEYIPLALRNVDQSDQLAIGSRRLLSSLAGEANDICSLSEYKSYCWLISTLQAEVAGFGTEPIVYSSGAETPDALSDTGTTDDGSDAGTENQFSDTDTPTDPVVGSKLNFYRWLYWNALHVAAQRGDEELSELLLDSGASISPLLRCTEPPGILRRLEYPTDYPYLQTPLYLAVAGGHYSTVQLLVRYGAPTAVSTRRVTALHVAAAHGVLDVCKFLVENNTNPLDGRTDSGLSPFHYAATAGKLTTAGRYLWERGADIRASNQIYFPGNPTSNALTHALYSKRYSDALMLLDMNPDFAVSRLLPEHPLRAVLFAPGICEEDEEHIVPIFRRLLSAAHQPAAMLCENLLCVAALRHLPRIVDILLKAAQSSVVQVPVVDFSLNCAFYKPRSSAAVETIALLLDYGIAMAGMSPSDISRLFMPDLIHQPENVTRGLHLLRSRGRQSLQGEGAVEITVEIAKMLHERLEASPRGVDRKDLRVALMAACRPGCLKVCEWLSSLGALHCVDHVDLVEMLAMTALSANWGGSDVELAEWVLAQADMMGLKGWVLKNYDVPRIISISGNYTIARLLIRRGASFDAPQYGGRRKLFQFGKTRFDDCYTRHRQRNHTLVLCDADNNIFFTVCSWPDMEGADEMLRLALDAADQGVGSLVNCALSFRDLKRARGRFFTPASHICRTKGTEPDEDMPTSEPAPLAMLKILLGAGAEVHAMVECSRQYAKIEEPGENGELPRESLWSALFWEGERQPSQEEMMEASADLAQKGGTATLCSAQSGSGCQLSSTQCSRLGHCPTKTTLPLCFTSGSRAVAGLGRCPLIVYPLRS